MKLKTTKTTLMLLAIASVSLGTVSCKKGCTDPQATNYDSKAKKDDGSCVVIVDPTDSLITVTGSITANTTWSSANMYKLEGKVVVENGATLTIQPGTIIKGAEGTESLASALVIARGGKIDACGTAAQPIIFTSVLDDIQIGELTGSNLTEIDRGLWGGVLVLGKAPISAGDGDVESQIEGIPASEVYGTFGGNDPADNSGTLCYISIRHGGIALSAGKEINGLTLGGVGNGTTINNVEVVANFDDGVEFFGGTVNVSNVAVGYQKDDGVDLDMNYSGTISNFVVVNASDSDETLEIDGPEGITYTNGLFTIENGTVYAFDGSATHADFKSKAQGAVSNVVMEDISMRASYQNACMDAKEDAFTHLTDASPTLTFSGSQFGTVSVYTGSDDGSANPVSCTVSTTDQTTAESMMNSTTATGADASSFATWTWMGVNAKF